MPTQPQQNDDPKVLAYRVGQLEVAVKEGLQRGEA